ncbi:uncharacterized protein LOC129909601 [Episyrphus balteatus]|uniref:uncharacterized protein LOC129909601 n=1 Tax=Episyrphus balteatus TaxID=286459 RepID=UPI0024866CBD|nr:uncharacterized protein LOC129909601 [Episyrphus balteatus]
MIQEEEKSSLITINVLITQSSTLGLNNATMAEVALYIIQEHISNLTSTIVIAEHSITPESAKTNAQFLDFLLQNLNESISVQFHLRGFSHQPLEYYVFIVDTVEAFRYIFRYFVDTPNERHYRFLIFLTKRTEMYAQNVYEFIFLCNFFDVIDVGVIIDSLDIGVSLFCYYPFTYYAPCRSNIANLIHSFTILPGTLKEIFPPKLGNFHGCPLKVSARIYHPYFSFVGNKSNPEPVGNWDNISGIEGNLLKFLAMIMNFRIDLQPFPKERCYIHSNQSDGCLKQLKDRKVDIAVGGFVDSNDGRLNFSPTGPYHTSPLRFIVRGKQNLSSLGRLAMPFTKQVWIIVAVFFVFVIILTSALKLMQPKIHQFIFGEENYNPATNFLAVFLGYSVARTPRRNFARYTFSLLLSLTLVLRNAYQGSLYDAFCMNRFAKIPSGFEDLVKWNYTIVLPPEASEILNFPNKLLIKSKNDGYEPRLKILDKLQGKYATVAVQDGFINYVQRNIRSGSQLLIIKEVIYNYQFVMYLPKHSIYLSVFNKKLRELAAAGMLSRLRSKYTKINEFILANLMQQQKKEPLQNKRLYALYSICGLLILISIVVFCLEIFSVQYTRWQRFFS